MLSSVSKMRSLKMGAWRVAPKTMMSHREPAYTPPEHCARAPGAEDGIRRRSERPGMSGRCSLGVPPRLPGKRPRRYCVARNPEASLRDRVPAATEMLARRPKRERRAVSTPDDRAKFAQRVRAQSEALGRDRGVFNTALDALQAADKYDYTYLWSWMGVPIIQLPADVLATQEVIWATKPKVIIETGVARGGSVLFMASLLELIGEGKVIGVDIDIRAHNRNLIERHPMAKRVVLIEGPSTEPTTLTKLVAEIPAGASVMVVLDSDHSREHVLAELRSYGSLVTPGCYLVVADTILGHLDAERTPRRRSKVWFKGNEPLSALEAYLKETDRFEVDPVVNGKLILSSSPGGYLRCRSGAMRTIRGGL
jgi:cephalosporin hydroxylase